MSRFHPFLYIIPLLTALFFFACADQDNEISLEPELFAETFAFTPNPAFDGETVVGYVAWEDPNGDFAKPKLSLVLEDEYGDYRSLPYANLTVQGHTKGVLTFEITVTRDDEGEITLFAFDEAGNQSDEITTLLYVSPLPGQE
ncbi:MAG TPA: hypothetical protein PK961_18195 [bacterium]|nr:hypothetical protein [bacterium]